MDDPAPAELPTIGWREWVTMPHLGIRAIKAKVDTGARSSSLHALAVEKFHRHGKQMVRFRVHPMQRDTSRTVVAEAELLGERQVRSSGGHVSLRPVIQTEIELLGESWNIELTLASRDTMGFRMLLGRQAVRGRFTIDPGRSFLAGKLKRKKPRQPTRRRRAR